MGFGSCMRNFDSKFRIDCRICYFSVPPPCLQIAIPVASPSFKVRVPTGASLLLMLLLLLVGGKRCDDGRIIQRARSGGECTEQALWDGRYGASGARATHTECRAMSGYAWARSRVDSAALMSRAWVSRTRERTRVTQPSPTHACTHRSTLTERHEVDTFASRRRAMFYW